MNPNTVNFNIAKNLVDIMSRGLSLITIPAAEAVVIHNALRRDQNSYSTKMATPYQNVLCKLFGDSGEVYLSRNYAKLLQVWFELGRRTGFFVPIEIKVLEAIFARIPNS